MGLTMHAQLSHHDRPRRLLNVSMSVRSRLGNPRLGGYLYDLPVTIVPQHRLRRVARAHIQLHRRPLYQNSYQQAALPPEAHTFVGTQRCQRCRVGTVGRGCQVVCCADALRDIFQHRASDVPLRMRAQNSAFEARSERAHQISVED